MAKPTVTPSSGQPDYLTQGVVRWRAATDVPLLALAIASLPLLALEIDRSSLPSSDRRFIDIVNVVVLVAFSVDYVVELVLSRSRRQYIRFEWSSLLIVIAQIAAVLPGLAGFGVLRILRGARAFRAIAVVARMIAIGGAAASQGRTALRERAATLALSVAALTWLTSAVAFTLAEGVDDPSSRIQSFGDSLWWSISTMATVGYGDIYPVTALGRIIGGVTMIVGIATFAVVTAKVAEFLVRQDGAPTMEQSSPSDADNGTDPR